MKQRSVMAMKSITWHLLVVGLLFAPTISSAETMFRCDDGSFTNRTDAGCSPYEPQGTVRTSPDGQPPAAIRDRPTLDTTVMTAILPPGGKASKISPSLCTLYEEWQILRRSTHSGTVLVRKRDMSRWQALSRLFGDVGVPQCAVRAAVQAAHSRP
jgi:hypothetical protein